MPKFTASDGLKIAYEDSGSGLPILCLAGLTRDHHDFDELVREIGAEVRLIRMDYRGRGESDWDPNPLTYTPQVESRDAGELLDHLGIEQAGIIGTSRGGMNGMFLASTAKARLRGVLLNDVGPELDREDLGTIVNFVGVNPAYPDYAAALAHYPGYCEGFANIPTARWEVEVQRLWKEVPGGLAVRYDPELKQTVRATFEGPDVDLWPYFDAMDGLPIALLRGANSRLLTMETVAKMQARRSDMLFTNVPDRAHIPFLDEDESLAVIRAWIGAIS